MDELDCNNYCRYCTHCFNWFSDTEQCKRRKKFKQQENNSYYKIKDEEGNVDADEQIK